MAKADSVFSVDDMETVTPTPPAATTARTIQKGRQGKRGPLRKTVRDAVLQVRVTSADRRAFEKAAFDADRTLSEMFATMLHEYMQSVGKRGR